MKRILSEILRRMERPTPEQYKFFVGFDGCIDTIVRPVKKMGESGEISYFEDIKEFADFVGSKSGKSCCVELHRVTEKAGGNATIYAQSLSKLGVKTACVGAFGYPEPVELFRDGRNSMELVSVSEPGRCTALEFKDGKVMFSETVGANSLNYECLVRRVGEERLYRMLCSSGVIALMNWSEIPGSTGIWKGFLENFFPRLPQNVTRMVFVDISDCSRRESEDILYMLQILKDFSCYCNVTLSLNQNEFEIILTVLGVSRDVSMEAVGKHICKKYRLQYLVVHLRDGACAFCEDDVSYVPTRYICSPVISTGGGDNFNAGLTYGLVSGMSIKCAMAIGNASSGFYVSHGYSAELAQLRQYIEQWKEEEEVKVKKETRELRLPIRN